MKIVRVGVIAVFGFLLAAAYGDEAKSYKVNLPSATIGTNELSGGEYTVLVRGGEPKVRLMEVKTGNAIEIVAKVETADKKFGSTEVHSREIDGVKQISGIAIGGTKLRIEFQHDPAL